MVYVLSKNGQPLMPTEDYRMVRLLLHKRKAKVVQRTPFTIKLLISTHCYKQPVTLGIDAGSKMIGVSATTEKTELKEIYQNVSMTFGYITKNTRIRNKLEKTHAIDARCISGNPMAKPIKETYFQKSVRRHNRQLHKATINKGGTRKANQALKHVFGYQLFDKVLYKGQEAFIFGRRSSGSFDIRMLDGTKLSAGVSYK